MTEPPRCWRCKRVLFEVESHEGQTVIVKICPRCHSRNRIVLGGGADRMKTIDEENAALRTQLERAQVAARDLAYSLYVGRPGQLGMREEAWAKFAKAFPFANEAARGEEQPA